jgi:hypothetical protein
MAMRSRGDPMKHGTVSRITATVELPTRHRLTPPNDVFFVALLSASMYFLFGLEAGCAKAPRRTRKVTRGLHQQSGKPLSGIFINTSRRPDLLEIIEK